MANQMFTVLAKGEHIAIIGDVRGETSLSTVFAVEQTRAGVFDKPALTFYRDVLVARSVRVEGETLTIKDTLAMQTVRYAALGEVVECVCGFDGLEKVWYVQENSCVSEKLSC